MMTCHKECIQEAQQIMVDRLRAYIKLVFPAEMTPHAKHILEKILEQYDGDTSLPANVHSRSEVAPIDGLDDAGKLG